ncbi:hypothetical protein [Schleiferilactobacillus harbinensis]|uniref:DUF2479 domain-containing protein n=1 Tax=Schleiferilactobacillus harbinensis TaxID=304207 RepID=A0A5P8M3R8_9LACO|nr:hypothetical protein [Schleiferilactobacillus harbinensis]QFR23119.1 hypothetical protein D1010_06710 [Schleiferilactobacillus harbinensis]
MENPKMPVLWLDLAKVNSYVAVPLRLNQGDKGYVQPFGLSSGSKALTDKDIDPTKIGLKMLKPDRQYIDAVGGATYADGQYSYPYPDEVAQAPGVLTGYFYVTDDAGKIIASTQKFVLTVAPTFADGTGSNSYVQAWDKIYKQLTEALTAALASRDTLDQLASSGQGIIDAKIAELTQSVNDWTTKTLADLTKALADKQAALDQLNTDYTAKLQAIATEWTTAKTGYDSQATVAMTKVADDAKAQRDALEAQFTGTFLAGLRAEFDTLKAQWTTSLADLQQALNTAKTDQTALRTAIDQAQKDIAAVNDKIAAIDPDAIKAGIKAAKDAADAAQKTADTANAGVGAINGKLGTIPDGSTVMAEIAKGGKVQSVNGTAPDAQGNVSIAIPSVAGMVKSATINGGSAVQADANGNLALTVPNPDLSGFVTQTDLDGRKYYTADQVKAAINSALTEFKTTLIWSGTQAEYDKLTADQKAQYIALGVIK